MAVRNQAAAAPQARRVHQVRPDRKKVSEMDDQELQRYVTRLRNEKDVLDLKRQINSFTPKQMSTGEKIVKKVVKDVLSPAATEASKRVLTEQFVKIGKEVWVFLPEITTRRKRRINR